MATDTNHLLLDELTGLPTIAASLGKVRGLLESARRLGLIYIDLTQYDQYEEVEGGEKFDRLVRKIAEKCHQFISEISEEFVLAVDWPSGGDLVAFVVMEDPDLNKAAMHEICQMLNFELTGDLHGLSSTNGAGSRYAVYVGYDVIHHNPLVRFERVVHRGINGALNMALNEDTRERNYRIERLKDIVQRGDLRPMFQPIVNLQKGFVVGYEVLIRGPENTKFEDPSILFATAHHSNMALPLERAGQAKMLDYLRTDGKNLFFVNVEPNIVENDDFLRLPIVAEKHIPHHRIVMEITERAAIKNIEIFSRAIKQIKKLGMRVAVDDVGSGYSSIESVAFLKPDFIKIDRLLIHGIHDDATRREIATTILQLSNRIGSTCIAEGIELAVDFECLVNLGVELGQGFHIGRPKPWPERIGSSTSRPAEK